MAETSSEIEVVTFGCRLNAFESEVIRRHAVAAAMGDAVIIHSCAVTAEAERQARQAIRRARRERPDAKIIVTGCSAQISGGGYAAMPEVDHVVGNLEKLQPGTWQRLAEGREGQRILVGDIMSVREMAPHLVPSFDGRTRAFLEVQSGCDHRCTFCIIPFGRGPSRSVAPEMIIAQAEALLAHGYREIVITGVDIASYGSDLAPPMRLGGMLRLLLDRVPALPRLRLSSLDPAFVDDELRALFADEPRLMPHLHLSVQAGDDLTLKRMKRRHSRRQVVELCAELRRLRPDIVFGADLIAGFPTETDAMFANTAALLEEADLAFIHVFPYSARSGTPAARMPQMPVTERRLRARRLRELAQARLDRILDREVGSRARLLVERGGSGRSEHFLPIRLAENAGVEQGQVVEVRLVGREPGGLLGECAP